MQYRTMMSMMLRNGANMNLGREKLPWSQDIWNRIDQAVHDEYERTNITRKFIPLYGPIAPGELIVIADTVVRDGQTLTVNESATIPLVELQVEFTLTPQQVHREGELMTAVTLATRAGNLLAGAADVITLHGQSAIDGIGGTQHPLFADNKVRVRSGPAGDGLLKAAEANPIQVIQVTALDPVDPSDPDEPLRFGERTFAAVADGYSRLQSGTGLQQAHYGPYALVLHNEPYADTYAPLATTLIMPADRIKPLMTAGFFGTGTLPATGNTPNVRETTGVLVSLGGNTMDLVVGMGATTAFLQEDTEGRYRFRVYERFALRLKDTSSVIKFEFVPGQTN
ncbi:MAG TPA: encapsulin [Blastocatellia bacterium]|nr:encapsulin [Blastocatellia bacterium]